MAATEKQWYVGEDGCISVGVPASAVTYHSALNSIIVSTKEPSVKIYDVASGALLQKSDLSANTNDAIHAMYLPGKDKVVFADDQSVGARIDLRGMLLLDTALQTPVSRSEDQVKVEIPLAEAGQFHKALMNAELPGIDHVDEVCKELEKKIDAVQEATKGHLKAAKWATICLKLPFSTLKTVCTGLVNEMKRLSMNNPGLSVASSIGDRLNYLLPNNGEGWSNTVERSMMYSEVARQKTFRTWPHMNYKWALPDPMSQAGFYHQPNSMGDDRAMCFTCNVCLVCWEPTDEPWSEHERHSPTCPFVKGEYTQNVPLAVTYGSQPAKRHGENEEKIECLSTTATENFVATSTLNGNIVVWSVDKILKKYCQFNLDPSSPVIALKTGVQIERQSTGSPSVSESVNGVNSVQDETDARLEESPEKVEDGSSPEGSEEQPTATTSTSVSPDTVYELPQEKVDKSDVQKTRNRPCEDVLVKSMCVVRKPMPEKSPSDKSTGAKNLKAKKKSRSKPHPTLFCGVSLRQTKLNLPIEQNNVEHETEEVELMNKVNEVVSSDTPQIISSGEQTFASEEELVDSELLQSTVFIPYLLVLALREDQRKGSKHKEREQKRVLPSSASLNNLNAVPNLGSISMMNHDFSLIDPMFDSDPDPAEMLIGVTPGPVSLTSESSTSGGSSSVVDARVPTVSKPSSSKHTKTGSVLQCVELPIRLQSDRYKISAISPTLDGQHILVIVSPTDKCYKSSSKSKSSVITDSSPSIDTSDQSDEFQTFSCSFTSVPASSEHPSENSSDHSQGGCILLYKYKFGDDYACLEETPIITKYLDLAEHSVSSVIVLPQEFSDYQEREEDGQTSDPLVNSISTQGTPYIPGQAAVTLSNGKLWLLSLNDLRIVAEIIPPEAQEKFVSAAYCTGMERLCVCSADGKLHFYQLCEDTPVLSDSGSLLDVPNGLCNGETPVEAEASTSTSDSSESRENFDRNSPGTDVLAKKPLTVDNLILLHNLIQFENLMPRFTATVPSCWTEIQQEQQQRRHPQHLQHQGEATQHTRTWKLQPDSSTWDEHLFEIVLPRPCCVGHVDIKFTLHPMCTSPPDVQITLLKQNATTLGRQSNTSHTVEVDKSIDFNINGLGPPQEEEENANANCTDKSNGRITEGINSVLDPEFLEDHNAEILCGPVNLASFLDLSGNSGLITLTSPQLMSTKPKAFLIHIKGFHSKNDDKNNEKQRELKKKSSSISSTQKMMVMKSAFDKDIFIPPSKVKEALTSSVPRPKFADNFRGCDWIQEVSVTIRKMKRTQIPKERLQRCTMIENLKFHERLMAAVGLSDGYVFNGISADCYQNMALDILLWISGVQMNDPFKRAVTKTIPNTLKMHLESVVRACFVQGTRTTAHKCSRLLAMCMEHCKKMADLDMAPSFSYSLLHALLASFPLLPSAQFAGAVRWFFTMLNRVKCMDITQVSQACSDLLVQISKQYNERMSPLHALLKSRFGLYGHPFDPDLFDIELPLALKQTVPSVSFTTLSTSSSNSTTTGNTNNNLTAPSSSSVTDELDYYDLFNPPSDKSQKVQLEYAKGSLFGLMEVEPLHFTCHSTSDGTKMERMDNNSTAQSSSLGTAGLSGTINFGEGIPPQATANIGASTLASLSSSMAVTKQHLHELSSKSYPTFKHKIMHIKQILSEVGKILPPEGKPASSDHLMPPTPKSTPMVITPPLTPPNETFQNQGSAPSASDGKSDNNKHFSAKSALGGLPNAQTLLQQPPLQVLVIERMHSGARRFVTLDFGKPIVLTDVVIPSCTDLASLSIDVWVQGEELDGQRFVVASDIGVRSLIMTDIMPPVVCRYLKITTIGRFGSGSTRSKIPIGAFYGHSCLLPWEWNSYLEQRSSSTAGSQSELPTQSQLLAQLGIYMSLLEDIQCRYSLARTRLESLLTGLDGQQFANSHIQYFLKKNKKQNNDEDNKITQCYNDCLQLQVQLNLAKKATERLHTALGFNVPKTDYGSGVVERVRHACTDKLRFVQECLLEVLLSITTSSASIPQPPMSLYNVLCPQTAEMLFKNLCVHGTKKIQISCGMLLMRVCGSQPWWGSFLGNVLREFFHSENSQIFPQDRVFVLLLAMGQKSLSGPSAVSIMESLLDMLARVLSPLMAGQSGMVDLTLVGWILLFLCRSLDHTALGNDDCAKGARKDSENSLPNRWNFIQGDHNSAGFLASNSTKSKSTKLVRGSRLSMQKRMLHHRQKLMDLQQAQKTFFSNHPDKSSQNSSNTLLKQQEKEFKKELSKYASKHIKDIIQMRRTEVEMLRKMGSKVDAASDSERSNGEEDTEGALLLSKEKTLQVVKGLMSLLLSMDFTCNVDLFLITCKVIATVCVSTRPAITLAEAMSQEQLERLILLASNLEFSYGNISWGGPWAGHAITCLLQDILDGEKFYPAHSDSSVSDAREETAGGGFTTETDESLPHSVSLPTMEDLDTDQDNSVPDTPDMELSDSKEEPSKMTFDKESSLMVDLLLDDMDYEDETSAKLHAYVTGESVKPPPPPEQILFESGLPTSSLNGTLDMANSIPVEMEDKKKDVFIKKIVDKITERERESWTSGSPYQRSSLVAGAQGMSTALDARLEFGLETQSELRLKVMLSLHTEGVQQAFSHTLPSAPYVGHTMYSAPPATDDELSQASASFAQSEVSSAEMLSSCYNNLLCHLLPHCSNLDSLLQLWLTLNSEGCMDASGSPVFDSSRTPLIPLSSSSVATLLEVLTAIPSLPISTWVLSFQSLTLVANQRLPSHSDVGEMSMIVPLLSDANLMSVIKKFLSGTSENGPTASSVQFSTVGPAATKAFYEFLLRLLVKCPQDHLQKLKELMLKLVYTLSAERGAFHCGLGPLDAQCKFMDFILDQTYENIDLSNAISVIESISSLVHQHIMCQEKVSCRSTSENSVSARSCFGGLFASFLRGGDSKSSDASRDLLMCCLLKLVNNLIQIQCNSPRSSRLASVAMDTSTAAEPRTPTNISMSEPVPDSAKLQQALATSTPTPGVRLSDEEKSQQTDEQKTETLNTQADQNSYITDVILGHQQIMCNLIQALSYCNSNTMATILGSRGISTNMRETFTGGEPISVGDGIYQILVTLSRLCSDNRSVIESLFKYLSGSYSIRIQQSLNKLSEPLLWFILKVLDNARAIGTFLEMGGISIICQNLVNCNCRIISTNPSLISTIMQNLNGRSRFEKKSSDFESPDGLQNFAPLGSISSGSPTASPAEVLIQSAPPHRRARSAAWSYHFYPDEAWVDLTIQLPFAVLLKEVQIQPHSTSLTTCPSSVSIELSHDGVTSTPLCHPLMTSSLAFIKLQFQRPQIATMVTIRLHRARDSMTIGLSQIMLMGYSAFGDSSAASQNMFMPNEDYVARSSVRWIRLLHHCLTAYKEVEESVASAAAQIPNLMNTCSALLVSPISSVYVPNIEEVLLRLGLHSVDMGLALVDNILRSPSNSANSGLNMPYLGKVSGQANESTMELLYQLGIVQDSGTRLRVQALLNWLKDSAQLALQRSSMSSAEGYRRIPQELSSLPSPAPSHIQCVSAILWQSNDLPVEYDLGSLITRELVSSLYEWSTTLKTDSNLKQSVDFVLCAICYINPEYFSQILQWMNISVTGENSLSASISDDRKDNSHLHRGSMTDDSKDNHHHRSMTDDSKEASGAQDGPGSDVRPGFVQDFRHITLEESCLSTLALTCQSAVAIKQLLDSGFPAVLAQGLFEFCNKVIFQFTENYSPPEGMTDAHKSMCDEGGATGSVLGSMSRTQSDKGLWISAEMVPSVLSFLAKVASEPLMKDWLGGHEGNIFWPSLLTMLCNTPIQSATAPPSVPREGIMTMESRGMIESAAVSFFTQVMSCHVMNQLLFAKVLCEVIKEQSSSSKSGQLLGNFPLSGFTRCLFLQALLEDEKIVVVLKNSQQNGKFISPSKVNNAVYHPRFTGGRDTQVMLVSLHTTVSEVTSKVTDLPLLPGQLLEKSSEKSDENKKDSISNYTEMMDYFSSSVVAASVAAKEKREKEDKSGKTSLPPRPPTRRGRQNIGNSSTQVQLPSFSVCHRTMPNTPLPGDLTLSQLLQILNQRGLQHGLNVLEFSVKQESDKKDSSQSDQSERDGWGDLDDDQALTTVSPFLTSLQVFASVGGLALLAEHLPLLYPEVSRQSVMQESGLDHMIKNMSLAAEEWSMIEPFPEDFYEHYELSQPLVSKSNNPPVAMPTIPPHSLVAFGLFLRLPGYADVLLKERKKAQCLLRLVLGVTDDGDGGHILTSPIASSLPTLPFLVLKSLYDSSPLTTDDGVLLRRMSLEIWAIHLILACLSVLSHHAPRVPVQGFQQEAQLILSAMQSANTPASVPVQTQTEEKSQQYWAKGTGFGTGSTTSSWDAEQALMRQKSEEEHVACLLQVLASYINPGGDVPKDFESENFSSPAEKSLLPDVIYELLSQSCIVPAISSYLRNDSVLDMARHIPLYRALLELLRGIAVTPSLVPLLLPLEKDNGPDTATSVGVLLDKMRVCVDTYASRLRTNKAKNGNGNVAEEEENEGLAMLIPNIQETAKIVKIAAERLQKLTESESSSEEKDKDKAGQAGQASVEEHYMTIMQEEQFGSFEFVLSDSSVVKFTCSHHYENNVKAAGDVSNASRTRRLAQEATTLSTSLPLSGGSSVFVRCDEERLDIMKVMITGPSDTPYENGCFEFDVYFPPDYPTSPPLINLETTGNHTIRFNPNLYNDGKVCLSVLNTWHGRPEEKWNAQTSSFLQVLVSIQSLILVSEPYFNEPGYERSRGTPSGTASSREYDANIRQATVRWAMLEQIRNPTPCFREVIHKHFWLKRHEVLKQCENWIAEMESYSNDKRTGRTIAHSTLALKRHYNQLREEIAKMKPPEGLEDEEGGESIDPQGVHFSTDSALSSAMSSSQLAVIENLITDSNSNSVLEDGFC